MRARIHLIVAAHLSMAPRAQREASALQAAGHELTISGVWFDEDRAALDTKLGRRLKLAFRPALDIRPGATSLRRWVARARGRCARVRFNWTRAVSPALLGYGVAAQLDEARRMMPDLTIVHGEGGLWIAEQLLRDGHRIGVDFEDWFSRDLAPDQRALRPISELARLEKLVLAQGRYRIASSEAMARALAETFGVPAPKVVTNAGQAGVSPAAHRDQGPLRLHWFSQTIGPARGLELLFAALPLVRSAVRLELRGACTRAHRAWLDRLVPAGKRAFVTISEPVPPWELPARLAEHDVGLALETATIPSRDVCIPNKFFQYLSAGLAVIATATQGQREAMSPCPDAGILVTESSPHELAAAIDRLATDRPLLARAQSAARESALGPWNGERENNTILAEAEQALRMISARALL
jgi:glycosyltransferase involved in cell wall biosynthesis